MAKIVTQQEMSEIVSDYITKDCGGFLDACHANVLAIVDRCPDHTLQGLKAEQQIIAAIQKGGLIENQEIKSLVDTWLRSNKDWADVQANRDQLRLAFLYPTGKANSQPRTLATLNTHAQDIISKGQLARSAESIEAERETQRQVAAATRQAQEQTKMIKELLEPWAAKVSKSAWVAGPGEITPKQYQAKEDELYTLSFDDLKARHTETLEKRALRSMSPAELKLKVRTQGSKYVVGNQHVERYLPLPRQLVFPPEIHPRVIDRDLLLWISNNDMPRYKNFLERYGAQQISDRIDGKDGN